MQLVILAALLLASVGFTQAAIVSHFLSCPTTEYPTFQQYRYSTKDQGMSISAATNPSDSGTVVPNDPEKALAGSKDSFLCPNNFFFEIQRDDLNYFTISRLCFNVKSSARVEVTLFHLGGQDVEEIGFTPEEQDEWSKVCVYTKTPIRQIWIFYQNCEDCTSEVKTLYIKTCRQ